MKKSTPPPRSAGDTASSARADVTRAQARAARVALNAGASVAEVLDPLGRGRGLDLLLWSSEDWGHLLQAAHPARRLAAIGDWLSHWDLPFGEERPAGMSLRESSRWLSHPLTYDHRRQEQAALFERLRRLYPLTWEEPGSQADPSARLEPSAEDAALFAPVLEPTGRPTGGGVPDRIPPWMARRVRRQQAAIESAVAQLDAGTYPSLGSLSAASPDPMARWVESVDGQPVTMPLPHERIVLERLAVTSQALWHHPAWAHHPNASQISGWISTQQHLAARPKVEQGWLMNPDWVPLLLGAASGSSDDLWSRGGAVGGRRTLLAKSLLTSVHSLLFMRGAMGHRRLKDGQPLVPLFSAEAVAALVALVPTITAAGTVQLEATEQLFFEAHGASLRALGEMVLHDEALQRQMLLLHGDDSPFWDDFAAHLASQSSRDVLQPFLRWPSRDARAATIRAVGQMGADAEGLEGEGTTAVPMPDSPSRRVRRMGRTP